jgi:hypothetical protein
MNEQKLNKFANNLLSDKREIEKVISWIEASEANQQKFNKIKNFQGYANFLNFEDIQNRLPNSPKRHIGFRILQNMLPL